MKNKLVSLLNELNHGLIERQEAVKLSLLAALAGEHMLLVGPPGTGKSMIARRIAACFDDNDAGGGDSYFEYLLTKFSTPEEIFGPLSISELKSDRFKRNTTGYLPTVKIAFLDEIFKASSSILNSLLTILNERIYHNGTERQKVPLQSLIAASNELPSGQDELHALYDRFLVRCFVDYVSTDSLPRFFESDSSAPLATHLAEPELKRIREAASAVTLPPLVQEVIQEVWAQHKEMFKEDRREQLSDRRLRKIIHLLRVAAATNGRGEVDLSDLLLLKNCLWNHPDNSAKVRDFIFDSLKRHSHSIPVVEGAIPASGLGELQQIPAQPPRSVIKGYSGSGTAQDPILIGTVGELMGLTRAEVGLKGYHFRQTADIDCSELSSWEPIAFCGNYCGSGYCISNICAADPSILRGGVLGSFCSGITREEDCGAVFGALESGSKISNLKLLNCCLAVGADGAHIESCHSNKRIIFGAAQDSQFSGCITGDSLIGGSAVGCIMSRCQTESFLIKGERAEGCIISDCRVVLNYFGRADEWRAGVVKYLAASSVVERCLVTGKCSYSGSGYFYFSGIAIECVDSRILSSALGPFEKSSSDVKVESRIAKAGAAALENNVAIDSVAANGYVTPDGRNGRSVPFAAFNQYFFEHTLGWDFSKVWRWDQQTNSPTLRDIGVDAAQSLAAPPTKGGSVDLLSQQLRANIWC